MAFRTDARKWQTSSTICSTDSETTYLVPLTRVITVSGVASTRGRRLPSAYRQSARYM